MFIRNPQTLAVLPERHYLEYRNRKGYNNPRKHNNKIKAQKQPFENKYPWFRLN